MLADMYVVTCIRVYIHRPCIQSNYTVLLLEAFVEHEASTSCTNRRTRAAVESTFWFLKALGVRLCRVESSKD